MQRVSVGVRSALAVPSWSTGSAYAIPLSQRAATLLERSIVPACRRRQRICTMRWPASLCLQGSLESLSSSFGSPSSAGDFDGAKNGFAPSEVTATSDQGGLMEECNQRQQEAKGECPRAIMDPTGGMLVQTQLQVNTDSVSQHQQSFSSAAIPQPVHCMLGSKFATCDCQEQYPACFLVIDFWVLHPERHES